MKLDLRSALGLPQAAEFFAETKSEGPNAAGGRLAEVLPELEKAGLNRLHAHGDLPRYLEAVSLLSTAGTFLSEWDRPAPSASQGDAALSSEQKQALMSLMPFKKGPFEIAGTVIDAEWQSDLKWQRLLDHGVTFSGKSVLDVGTGNGYFLYRLVGAGAAFALGLDPGVLFSCQFMALQCFFGCRRAALLPITFEQFPPALQCFDVVMSMGVLYHRRSPLDHLAQLLSALKPGGELVLETMVVPGPLGHTLLPPGRYAQMPNVWFLPSMDTLLSWLSRMGATDIRAGSPVKTTTEEQRATAWARGKSLKDFLDPQDPMRTVEGHPAPTRVLVTARKPR